MLDNKVLIEGWVGWHYQQVKALLQRKRLELKQGACLLLEKETLTPEDFRRYAHWCLAT